MALLAGRMYESGGPGFESWACEWIDPFGICDESTEADLQSATQWAKEQGGGLITNQEGEHIAYVDEDGALHPPDDIPEEIKKEKAITVIPAPDATPSDDKPLAPPPSYLSQPPPAMSSAWLWVGAAAFLGIWLLSGDS